MEQRSRSGFFATIKAVLWSFFGIRKGKDYESDAAGLNPIYVIIAAVGVVILFIAILLTIIHFVLAK